MTDHEYPVRANITDLNEVGDDVQINTANGGGVYVWQKSKHIFRVTLFSGGVSRVFNVRREEINEVRD